MRVYRVLMGISDEYRPLGRPRGRWEDNNKCIFKIWGRETWIGLIWLRIGTVGGHL